jgi:hypothetical protein
MPLASKHRLAHAVGIKVKSTVVLGATLIIAMAAATAMGDTPASAPPIYKIGQTLTYTKDGATNIVDTVTGVAGGATSWSSSEGWTWTKKAFLERATSWKDPKGVTGQQSYAADLDAIFPLKVGSEASASYSGSMSNGQSWTGTAHCKVASTVPRTVPAGTFDTYEIVCTFGSGNGPPYTTITHYYAPQLGADVVYREYTPKENVNETQQLVSFSH